MFSEEEYINVKLIDSYHFCPRIIYFTQVLGLTERLTESMIEGKEMHRKVYELEKRRKTVLGLKIEKVLEKWSGLHLKSDKLKLIGTVDFVVKTEKGFKVIEYKEAKFSKKGLKSHIYQATAYAMLFEENFNVTVRDVLIYYSKSKKLIEVPLTDDLRRHVLWTLRRIRKIIEEERMPEVKFQRKCRACGYYKFCKGI